MPIDLASVDWLYVIVLALFVFVAALFGNLLAFGRAVMGGVLSAVFFAAIFVLWTYYPHHVPLLPKTITLEKPAPATAAPAPAPAAPARPRNPVTDITPPGNPVTTVPPPPDNPK